MTNPIGRLGGLGGVMSSRSASNTFLSWARVLWLKVSWFIVSTSVFSSSSAGHLASQRAAREDMETGPGRHRAGCCLAGAAGAASSSAARFRLCRDSPGLAPCRLTCSPWPYQSTGDGGTSERRCWPVVSASQPTSRAVPAPGAEPDASTPYRNSPRGHNTQTLNPCFILPACASASSPQPQK